MNWLRYAGRAILAVGVIAIAIWATRNKLLDMPAYQFWTGILSYLIAAEVVWTLVDRKGQVNQSGLPRRGLLLLTRRDRAGGALPGWCREGGRARLSDVLAGRDSHRETLMAVHAAVMARVATPRVHRLTARPGSGRSMFLYRLGRTLVEADQPVFLVLPTPELLALDKVLEVARRQQVYLLVDDLDLRPEVEEWLYELERFPLPVVVIATSDPCEEDVGQNDELEALQPATLLARAALHDIAVSHNDVVALARNLGADRQLERSGLALDDLDNLLYATRAFRGRDSRQGLWQDLDQDTSLPSDRKLMVALAGAAEMGFPESIWNALCGDKSLAKWQAAGLVVAENGLVLPPHRLTCLDLLADESHGGAAVAEALDGICRQTSSHEPAFTARLLYALARQPETKPLARAQVESVGLPDPEAQWPEAVKRLWRRVLQTLDCLPPEVEGPTEYPPEINLLIRSAFLHHDYDRALLLARGLVRTPIYEHAAHFAAALALAHLGRLAEAEAELDAVKEGVPGVHFLRGVLAEMNGDVLRALDAYDTSRKADELQVSSTRRLAFAYVKSGAPRAAIPLFESLLSYRPRDAELYAGLAVANLLAGMAQRAAAQSARAIQAGVEPVDARKAVARACARVHAYGRAAAELEACVSYDEADMEAWQGLAEACHWLGRFPREEECLRRLQAVDPDNEELCLQTARCRRDQGQAQETLDLLQPLLTADQPDLRAVLLAAEVTAGVDDRELQEALARQAVQQGDDSGWAHYWLADSQAELTEETRAAYAQAIQLLQKQIQKGITPRQAATLWQGVYLSAVRLADEELATEAARKATQEAAICEALGADIHSVAHRRAVPTEVFLDSLPPYTVDPAGTTTAPTEAPVVKQPTIKPVTGPTESSTLRNRRLRGY